MLQLILGLLAGLVPSLALYFWLRGHARQESACEKNFGKALVAGLRATIPIVATSGALDLLMRFSGLRAAQPLFYAAIHAFVVLALVEELMKYLACRRFLRKTQHPYSWLDLTVMMTIIGVGFGMSESIAYLMGSSPVVMLIRGIVIPHGGYGAIVGWFYGRSVKTGRRGDRVLGFGIAWALHGLYDFSLSEEFAALNEDMAAAIALILTALNLALIAALIVFVVKARKNEKYTQPLFETENREKISEEA